MTLATIRQSWAEGESLSREALEIGIKELGKDHYYTKGFAEGLVDCLWQQGRVNELFLRGGQIESLKRVYCCAYLSFCCQVVLGALPDPLHDRIICRFT